ncbi:hypothetical protein [Proteiniphilum sp.]|uniref:hypothetical protein n=1 Tax=Proteiniphilum sp. TaxID=1926877 RepID=UPI003329F121
MHIFIKRLYFLSFLFFSMPVYVQQTVISGKATDKEDGSPLTGVLVTARPAEENRIVKFAQTTREEGYLRSTRSIFTS